MTVRVSLQEDEGAFPGAVVGLVSLRRQDPVPAEIVKVDGQFVSAAFLLFGPIIAVNPYHTLLATASLRLRFYLRKKKMHLQNSSIITRDNVEIDICWLM